MGDNLEARLAHAGTWLKGLLGQTDGEAVMGPMAGTTPAYYLPAGYAQSATLPPFDFSNYCETCPPSWNATITSGVRRLLNLIALGEGGSEEEAIRAGFDSSYDVTLHYGKFVKPSKPASKMSLAEIHALQTEILFHKDNDTNSSSVGRYQINRLTLGDIKKIGLTDDMIYNADFQDRAARQLLYWAGLDRDQKLRANPIEFQNAVAGRFESVEVYGTGRSFTGKTPSITTDMFQSAIADIL